MSLSMIRFHDPLWLAVGAACALVLLVALVRAEHLRTRALAKLAGSPLRLTATAPSGLRRRARIAALVFAVAAGFVALARPQLGTRWETVSRKGTDLLFVVDTSKSMAADDLKPSRLARVKLAIRDLVQRFPGDRIGLVAFAGDAFVVSPMTLDHGALLETVDALDTDVIARGGTDIGRAIDVAHEALASEPSRQKSLVLLTDGEDVAGAHGLEAAKKAAADGITIDTVGVGTPAGELVPAFDARGRAVGIAHDEAGRPVRSKLDEPALRAIAEATHGTYRPLGEDGRGLDRLYAEALASRAQVEATSRTHRVYEERFELPLALCLMGLVVDALLAVPARRKRERAGAPAWPAVAAALVLLGVPARAHASPGSAHEAYQAGRYDDAAKEYAAEHAKHPDDARLAYNAGVAAYAAGRFGEAREAFEAALAKAPPDLKRNVLYDMGDALYREGEATRDEDRDATKERWKKAIEAYEGALAADAKDEDARFNRDLVKKKLAELDAQKPPEPKKDDAKNQSAPKDKGGQGNPQDPKPDHGKQQQGDKGSPSDSKPDDGKKQDARGISGAPDAAKLGEKDARALLDALRGEEKRPAAAQKDAGAAEEPTNGKDW